MAEEPPNANHFDLLNEDSSPQRKRHKKEIALDSDSEDNVPSTEYYASRSKVEDEAKEQAKKFPQYFPSHLF